jgi:hypothetical protein
MINYHVDKEAIAKTNPNVDLAKVEEVLKIRRELKAILPMQSRKGAACSPPGNRKTRMRSRQTR